MLTAKQQQTYDFIKRYIAQHSYAPTEAEIATAIGIRSRGVVHRYVTALAEAGVIELVPKRRRNIRLITPTNELPIIGKIAAGLPIEAIADRTSLNIADIFMGEDRFVLQVSGDSMIGDNICDGDYIICEKTQTARANDIVVALIDNEEATLKRLQFNADATISLLPSNPRLSPMVYPADRLAIQGIYIGLLRVGKR